MGLYSAVARRTWRGRRLGPSQGVSTMDAVRVYTLNGAYASFEEEVKGSIEEGKWADIAVLSGDIFDMPPEAMLKVKVDMTFVGGRMIYRRPGGGINPR